MTHQKHYVLEGENVVGALYKVLEDDTWFFSVFVRRNGKWNNVIFQYSAKDKTKENIISEVKQILRDDL